MSTAPLRVPRAEVLSVVTEILILNGTSPENAILIADSLIQAQAAGHASHGIIRLIEYSKFVKAGTVIGGALPRIQSDNGAAVVIDASWGWGQLACKLAVDVAIAKSKEFGICVVTVHSCNHIGRLGEYVENLASHSLVGLMWCNSDPSVAAYGGKERVLGTNPFAAGIPTDKKPIVLDFATAASAEGKLRVARANGEQVKPGIILDVNGNGSTDPEDFYAGGSLLPFGEHKGYGLSLMIELLGGALSGNHPSVNKSYLRGNGTVLICIDPARLLPYQNFLSDVNEAVEFIRKTPPLNPKVPVMMPGDVENLNRASNEVSIAIDVPIWNSITELLHTLKKSS